MLRDWLIVRFVFLALVLFFVWGDHAIAQTPRHERKEVPAQQLKPVPLPKEKIQFMSGDEVLATVTVELALTPGDQERGLMGRRKMPKDTGMLFVFDNSRVSLFWMKNTLIALDMVFINAAGNIVKIHPKANPHDLTYISSDVPVRAAIELPGGMAAKYKLKVGDFVASPTLDRIRRDEGYLPD